MLITHRCSGKQPVEALLGGSYTLFTNGKASGCERVWMGRLWGVVFGDRRLCHNYGSCFKRRGQKLTQQAGKAGSPGLLRGLVSVLELDLTGPYRTSHASSCLSHSSSRSAMKLDCQDTKVSFMQKT